MSKINKIILILVASVIFVGSGFFFYSYKNDNKSQKRETITKWNKNKSSAKKIPLSDLKCPDCNLVIISLTNTRKDHIGLYGYKRNTTPSIDKFFKNSLIFENAFAPASWTLPVAVSFFTSLFPYTHGIMNRYDSIWLSDDISTITDVFKKNGYQTAGFTGGGDYSQRFSFNRGFDVYTDESGRNDSGGIRMSVGPKSYLNLETSLPHATKWLSNANTKKKFFLLVQGFDTHCPFTPGEPFKKKFIGTSKSNIDFSTCLWTFEQTKPIYENGIRYWQVKTPATGGKIKEIKLTDEDIKYMVSLYDGEIAQADFRLKNFFDLIKRLGLEKNTIFVFMSEHGDMFGEHGRFMRGGPLRGTFYDPVLNFPLLIKHPKVKEPLKIDALVQTVDLMPTLLEMLGLQDEQASKRQGKSILPVIRENKEINDYIYAASYYTAAKGNLFFEGKSVVESIRNKEWKLIKEEIYALEDTNKKISESYELYKISKDPDEKENVYKLNQRVAKDLKNKLEQWKNRLAEDRLNRQQE